jgi:BirA family biotin operon repressor/biotin-[acetyl-CoA-carboxylase] ligase
MFDLDAICSRLPSRFSLAWHDRVSSTNDLAAAAAAEGAPDGTVIGAEVQEAGRGRWGRTWSAEPGRALLFSLVTRPLAEAPVVWLGPAAALSVVHATRDHGADAVGFRWPNDVVSGSDKVAGVLIEQAGDAYVVGIGVNVSGPAWDVAPGVTAATLESLGAAVSREDLLVSILNHLSPLCDLLVSADATALLAATSSVDALAGRSLAIAAQGTEVEGRYAGMDERARLLLDTAAGRMAFSAGEVTRVVL